MSGARRGVLPGTLPTISRLGARQQIRHIFWRLKGLVGNSHRFILQKPHALRPGALQGVGVESGCGCLGAGQLGVTGRLLSSAISSEARLGDTRASSLGAVRTTGDGPQGPIPSLHGLLRNQKRPDPQPCLWFPSWGGDTLGPGKSLQLKV